MSQFAGQFHQVQPRTFACLSAFLHQKIAGWLGTAPDSGIALCRPAQVVPFELSPKAGVLPRQNVLVVLHPDDITANTSDRSSNLGKESK